MVGRRQAAEKLDDERKAHRVYAARIADLRAQGEKLVVIDRQAHPEQWRAWYAYFKAKGLNALVELMENSRERTVPTWWPHDFDLDITPQPERRYGDD